MGASDALGLNGFRTSWMLWGMPLQRFKLIRQSAGRRGVGILLLKERESGPVIAISIGVKVKYGKRPEI
jgi:hypothetical protein